jgi:hypothetical protein
VDFVEDASVVLGEEFNLWFQNYITEYRQSNYDVAVIKKNIPSLISFADKYIELKNIRFDDYIDVKKISNNSIFFDSEEIKKLVQVSNYLKLYFIISQDNVMKLPIKFHKEIYNILIQKINSDILYKLFKIVSSKTYRYTITDNYMWDYIRLIYCKTTDMHIHSIFNFLLNNILVSCKTDQNPISYMISVVDEAIRWILQSVYEDVIIYTDTINTEDTNILQSKDNLLNYAYNDTIGRLVIVSYKCLEHEGLTETQFNETFKLAKENSLFSLYVTYPILSKVLKIPYKHFLTIPAEHGYLLNIFLYHILPPDFKKEYPTITQFLLNYNTEKIISKTTYLMKKTKLYFSTCTTFKGFKNITFPFDFYSSVIGKLARNIYISFKTQEKVEPSTNTSNKKKENTSSLIQTDSKSGKNTIPLAKIEDDMIRLYNNYFGNNLDELYKYLEKEIDKYL